MPSPKERRIVVEDAHEPIIDRPIWDKVQLLRANKRRPTKTGATTTFSGVLYCADCGAKLSLNVSNEYKYFRCGGYKRNSRMNACSIHYIRESVLEQLVQKQLRQFLSYLQQFERVFVKQQIDCQMADKEYEIRQKQALTEQHENRLREIDYLFRKTYEDNATRKLSDEQFYRLSEGYEAEQEEIRTEIAKLTEEIGQADTAVHNI